MFKKSVSLFLSVIMVISVLSAIPIFADADGIDLVSPKMGGLGNYKVGDKIEIKVSVTMSFYGQTNKSLVVEVVGGKTYAYTIHPGDTKTVFTEYFVPKKAGSYTCRVALASGDYNTYSSIIHSGAYTSCNRMFVVNENKKASIVKKLSVKTKTTSIKAKDLKKSKKTVNPLTIKNAKKVKVEKVKKGTDKAVYKKIKVNKTTGKITFNKGKYKKKTYKVKLKISATGVSDKKAKTIYKVVKVKIK